MGLSTGEIKTLCSPPCSCILIKPDGLDDSRFMSKLYDDLETNRVRIAGTFYGRLSIEQAQALYFKDRKKSLWHEELYPQTTKHLITGPCGLLIVECFGTNDDDIFRMINNLKGKSCTEETWNPDTGYGWRGYGESLVWNRVHSPDDIKEADAMLNALVGMDLMQTYFTVNSINAEI